MDEKQVVGKITFSNIANPNTWNIGESKALVFSCPSEAKRGEALFNRATDEAYKSGYEAGLRRALDVASEWHTGNSIREAILAEIKGE